MFHPLPMPAETGKGSKVNRIKIVLRNGKIKGADQGFTSQSVDKSSNPTGYFVIKLSNPT